MAKFSIPMVLIVDGPNTDSKKALLKGLAKAINGTILYLEEPVFDREFRHADVDECIYQFGHINLTMFKAITGQLGISESVMSKRNPDSTRRVDESKWFIINRNPCNALDYDDFEDRENPIYSSLDPTEVKELETYNYTYRPCYLCVTEEKVNKMVEDDNEVAMFGLDSIIANLKVGMDREHYIIPHSVMLMASQRLYVGMGKESGTVVAGVFG